MIFESSNEERSQRKCYICSSATDGKMAFWDITLMLLHTFYSTSEENISSTKGANANCDAISDSERTRENVEPGDSGDTVGFRLSSDGVSDLVAPSLVISCHQSGINALDAFHVKGTFMCL